MTVERAFPDCPDCDGKGYWIKWRLDFDPPEQMQCERCYGTGVIDPLDKPDDSEPLGPSPTGPA